MTTMTTTTMWKVLVSGAMSFALTSCLSPPESGGPDEEFRALPEQAQAKSPPCAEQGQCHNAPHSCQDDSYEDNDAVEQGHPLALHGFSESWASFELPEATALCSGDEDWFLIPGSQLETCWEEPVEEEEEEGEGEGGEGGTVIECETWSEAYLFVRAQVMGASLCGAGCGSSELPAAPENTMTVSVYDAGGALITSNTSAKGNVWITHGSLAYLEDFYIVVSGPAAAEYDYDLYFDMRSGLFEDECEC